MARSTTRSPEAVEAAVKAILTNLGRPIPVSVEEFRGLVTLARVREFLGGGDRARLSNMLKQTEAKLLGEARAAFHVPHAPAAFVQQCQEIWNVALSTARAELAEEKRACDVATQRAHEAQANADNQSKMYEAAKVGHDTALAAYREQIEALKANVATLEQTQIESSARHARLESELAELRKDREDMIQQHADRTNLLEDRFAGERKLLMKTTDQIRQSFASEPGSVDKEQAAMKALERENALLKQERDTLTLENARLQASSQPDS